MSSFVHVDQPLSHPGVDRAEKVIGYVQAQSQQMQGARGLSAVLLAAVVAGLMAVADKFVTEWSDGSLFAAWLALWLVAFLGMALFAGAARSAAARGVTAWRNLSRQRAQARADADLLALARHDSRVLSDLKAAMTREEAWLPHESAPAAMSNAFQVTAARTPTIYEAMRANNASRYY